MNGTFDGIEARLAALERSRSRMRRAVVVLGVMVVMLGVPVVSTASHLFSDVPTGSTFHNDIAAIAAAGLTDGCTATTYCPNSPVTRGQMAAFLRRGGGTIAAEFGGSLAAGGDVASGQFSNSFSLIREVQLTVPGVSRGGAAHQLVHVQGRVILYTFGPESGCPCVFEAMVYNPEGDYTSPSQFNTLIGVGEFLEAVDIDTVIPITPGTRTFRLYLRVLTRFSSAPELIYDVEPQTSLIATTYPFGTVESQ